MGTHDFVKPVLGRLGTIHFGRVLMKPGKPVTFATVRGCEKRTEGKTKTLVFGLPGNPASATVCAHLFVIPVLPII
jgi:gephyrin